MPKRILFVITQSELGGAQRFLYAFTKYLKEKGHEMMVATSSGGVRELEYELSPLQVNIKYLRHLTRNPNPAHDILSLFQIRSLIKEYNPDTLFLLSSKAGFVGSLASVFPTKLKNLKVVYRIGGWTFNDPWPNWKKWFWRRLEIMSSKWKDVIIVNNLSDLEQAKATGINPRQSIKMVHNGVDAYNMDLLSKSEAREKITQMIREQTGRDMKIKNLVGTVANLYPAKGVENLIKAASYFAGNGDTTFVIIGEGGERAKLAKLIRVEGLTDRVYLLGAVKKASRYLSAFDVFVLPSLKEGFPWALIEAMAARLPVIATTVGAIPEIIEDGKNGFMIEKENPGQIAKRVKEILASESIKKELSIQAHQTVLLRFTKSKMLKETETTL